MPNDTIKLTVSIVHYRNLEQLQQCVDSVNRYISVPAEIIVVNHSNQSCAISSQLPLRIISQDNLGFGAGHNCAAQYAKGRILLFLNPDAQIVTPIDYAVHQLTDYSVGIVSPIVVDENNLPQRHFFGFDHTFFRLIANHFFVPRILLHTIGSVDVHWVSGVAMFIRRNDFLALGGFDERFFLYYEDADLCRRMRAMNRRVVVCVNARVQHRGGTSFRDCRAQKRYYDQSQARYFEKYYGRLHQFVVMVLRKIWRILSKRCS